MVKKVLKKWRKLKSIANLKTGDCVRYFIKEYNHIVDSKGRLKVPLKFEKQLGNALVVIRDRMDAYLYIKIGQIMP